MGKGLASLEGSAVDPDEEEEERQKRMRQTLETAQESGKDYSAGFHTGQRFIGADGWMYRRDQDGVDRRVQFMGKRK